MLVRSEGSKSGQAAFTATADSRGWAARATPKRIEGAGLLLFAMGFYVFFLRYTFDGLTSWFSGDDLMNLHNAWSDTVAELVRSNLVFWREGRRPMGLAFYRAVYVISGFNPLPFRVAALSLLTVDLWLMFSVVRRISGSVEAAIYAMCLTGVHACFVSLYYDTGMIFDVLAFFFYYSAFLYYLRIRTSRHLPTLFQTVLLLALFIAAVNSKEIAVSLPFAFLVFEWFWYPVSDLHWPALTAWLGGPARTGLLMGLLDIFYIVGRATESQSVLNHPAYRPHLSGVLYLQNYSKYISQLTYSNRDLCPTAVLILLCGIVLTSFFLRKQYLKWAALMIITAFLPLAFIPPRNGYAFYVPAVPWALWIAGLIVSLRDHMAHIASRCTRSLLSTSNVQKLLFSFRLATQMVFAALIIGWLAPLHAHMFSYPLPVIHNVQNANRRYYDNIRRVVPALRRGARVLLLNDPYPAGRYDGYFLIRLSFGDRTLSVDCFRCRGMKVDTDFSRYDVVLDFVGNQVVLRGRGFDRALAVEPPAGTAAAEPQVQ